MMKRILRIFIWCLVIGVLCLEASLTALAEEKISYAITITIPKIIEHTQLLPQQQAAKENADKKTDKENENTNPYLFYEPVVVVKTIIQEP